MSRCDPVSDILWPAFRVTASLVFGAAALWMLVAAPIGALGAMRPRSFGDVAGRAVSVLGMSIPVFWLAPMVSYFLAFQPTQGRLLGIPLPGRVTLFPIDGYVDFGTSPGAMGLSPRAPLGHARHRFRRCLHPLHTDDDLRAAERGLHPNCQSQRSIHGQGSTAACRPQPAPYR